MGIGDIKNRNIDNGDLLRKPAIYIGQDVMTLELVDRHFEDLSIPASKIYGGVLPAPHAITHSKGGTDEITVENLATASNDTALALKPDGAGGLAFGAIGGGGAFTYTSTPDYSLYGENNTAQAAGIKHAIQIGNAANASEDYAVSIGGSSVASGSGAVALGGVYYDQSNPTQATADYATAIGCGARALDPATVAVGKLAHVTANGSQGVAFGAETLVDASKGVAIGYQAKVNTTHNSSVSIGQSVQSTASDQVNLGVSNTKKIVFDTWSTVASGDVAATHTLAFKLGAATYKFLLTNV